MEIPIIKAEQLAQMLEGMLKDAKGITAYALAKNLRIIKTELQEYLDTKTKLFEQYGTREGDKITIAKDSPNFQKFMDEISIFEKENINFEFRKLKEEDLINSGLNGEQMYLLSEYFID